MMRVRLGGLCGLCCAVATTILIACTPSRPMLSSAVHDVKGVDCPEESIQVLDTRSQDDDTVYVLDACGKKIEIAKGLTVPSRADQVTIISAENPFEPPSNLTGMVPLGTPERVLEKIQAAWCLPPGKAPSDPDAFVFRSKTEAEHAECRTRLARELNSIGTQHDETTGEDIYWFRMGQYLFTASVAMYDPADVHRTRIARVEQSPEDEEASRAARELKKDLWFGRFEVGGGYFAHRTYNGGSIDLRAEAGVKFARNFGVALVTAAHWAVLAESERQSYVYDIGLGLPFYPIEGSGLRLDADGGLAILRYDFVGSGKTDVPDQIGAFAAAGVAYDFGANAKGASWSGLCLSLHGYYAVPDGNPTGAGILQGGLHGW